MSIAPSENAPWGFVQWAFTALATLLASAGAFLWRLMLRLEKLEAAQANQRVDIDAARSASEAAMLRLAERVAQMHDDHFRLRETIGLLPNRADLRELEDRLAERLDALVDRIDRVVDS
jgi:phage-related minor tail protein